MAHLKADPRLGSHIHGAYERGTGGVLVLIPPMAGIDFAAEVDRIVEPLSWYRTREIQEPGQLIQVFVETTTPPAVAAPRAIYHATLKANRISIERSGLTLAATSSTWTQRRYLPPRAHFARTVSDALTFIESSVTKKAALAGISSAGMSQLHLWDIYERLGQDRTVYADVEMENAVWMADPTTPSQLRRLSTCEIRLRGVIGYIRQRHLAAAGAVLSL